MAAPSLPGVDWNVAKAALAMGAKMEDVARNLGVGFRTLQKRAQRGKWVIATKAIRAAKRQDSLSPDAARPLPAIVSHNVSQTQFEGEKRGENRVASQYRVNETEEKAGAMILQHLQDNDDRGSVIASDIALDALSRAKRSKTKIKLESIQDVDKAVRVLKVSNGKNEDDSRVTVNLFAGGTSAQPVEAARAFRRKVVDVQSQVVP